MEDLLQPEGSKQRAMVISSSGNEIPPASACVSRSCPNISDQAQISNPCHGSLPDHLEPGKVLGIELSHNSNQIKNSDNDCPYTPPPSPSFKDRPEKNLVIISTLIVDPNAHNFESYYNSVND